MDNRIHAAADIMIEKGFRVIPIDPQSKAPMIKWGACIDEPLSKWTFPAANIAILTGAENGYVVVDCDSKESYKGWLANRPRTPLRVRTRKGMHFYYRHPGVYVMSNSHIKAPEGFTYDVKGDKSYCLMPPSMSKGHQYQICVCTGNLDANWIRPARLPIFDTSWRPVSEKQWSIGNSHTVRSAQNVLRTITAVEGQRDVATYHATMVCIDAGLNEPEAMQEVILWHSTNVSPPWSPSEVATKVRRVYREKGRSA